MKVLLTRPAEDNARIARRLAPLGVECLAWPLTRIVPLVERLEVPEGTEAILFTSANAVRAFAAASPQRELPVLCVGARTAECARRAGFLDVTSAGGAAAELARLARTSGYRRFLHPRGRDAGDLGAGLTGAAIEARTVYAAEPDGPPPPKVARAFSEGALGLVTIWSTRNAAILGDWLATARPLLGATALLGISETAVRPLRGFGFREVLVAARPDADTMVGRIAEALRQ